MGTILELFDERMLENVASHLLYPKEQIVYVGYPRQMTPERVESLRRFFQARHCAWEPAFVYIPEPTLRAVVETMEKEIQTRQDCRLDLTGGNELVLVAMGILAERHQLPMVQVDMQEGVCKPVFGACLPEPSAPDLTVEQLAVLQGGSVIRSEDTRFPTGPQLRADIASLWQLCREDGSFLNRAAGFLSTLASETNELRVLAHRTVPQGIPELLRSLEERGFLQTVQIDGQTISFSYREEKIKRILNKAGLALELLARMAAEDAGVYPCIRQGVSLEWDAAGERGINPLETRNEVDLILIRGMLPVFVSCKNGEVKKEALYELEVVAERFGGALAEKLLLCSDLTNDYFANEALRKRAEDMGVHLIDGVRFLTIETLAEKLVGFRSF